MTRRCKRCGRFVSKSKPHHHTDLYSSLSEIVDKFGEKKVFEYLNSSFKISTQKRLRRQHLG